MEATAAAAVVLAVVETMRSGAGDNEEQDWSRKGDARTLPRTPWNLARRQQQQGERGAFSIYLCTLHNADSEGEGGKKESVHKGRPQKFKEF